jgi:ribosomal-protein-alanine N-acetyltransferase
MKHDETGRLTEFGEFPVLETKRLILRPITLDDAEFWIRNFSDPDVVEETAFEPPRDIGAAKEEIATYCMKLFSENAGIRWGITINGSNQLIGTAGYDGWTKERGYHATLGYDLLREHRRKGIMREALTAIIDYGFETMKLHRIQVMIDPLNEASIKLVKGLGFIREGVLREDQYFRGQFKDDVVYSVLSREWANR